ncbi:transposase [Streptomyces sp. Ag109_O5-1]|uniref:transposase n=1 Tax=Streptomyces sp. Ag109_O5-1 TaxID=1938851 RepID=UPI001626DCD6|nr:transposase [Streptomyces sp. Ag109_O5-1]
MAENLTDRAAVQRVRFDLSWKYCLGLELEDVGFDASVLSEFRARVVEHGLEERVLDLLLAALKEKGLVKAGGKQRTDSTHVLAAVRELNRLELAGETVRAALEALSAAAPDWVARALDVGGWNRRYGRRIVAYWRPPGPRPSGTSSLWTTAATRWLCCGRSTIRLRHCGCASCLRSRRCGRSPCRTI